jgi:hypothetical protein
MEIWKDALKLVDKMTSARRLLAIMFGVALCYCTVCEIEISSVFATSLGSIITYYYMKDRMDNNGKKD